MSNTEKITISLRGIKKLYKVGDQAIRTIARSAAVRTEQKVMVEID